MTRAPVPVPRSMLSVPGSSERFIGKARDVRADAIAFDLEDSVAPREKVTARRLVAVALADFPADGRELWVRPNALDSDLLEADLDAVVVPGLHGLHLPKVDDTDTLMAEAPAAITAGASACPGAGCYRLHSQCSGVYDSAENSVIPAVRPRA
ncbi:aldolase/citrate lyase family protein [Streptomyces sp. NPDC059262]|uniref:aldolase/citrate lyase family protein n=1 Tax=Streptomyces sp. NPDC059262 TaxID=3346797 RepID=UPI00367AEF07